MRSIEFLILILVTAIPGVLEALLLFGLVSIPSVRRRLGRNGSARVRVAFCAALLAFNYAAFTYLTAARDYVFIVVEANRGYYIYQDGQIVGDYVDQEYLATLVDNRDPLIAELLLANMMPKDLYQPCYTRDAARCALLNDAFGSYLEIVVDPSRYPWIRFVLFSAYAVYVAGVLFYRLEKKFAG